MKYALTFTTDGSWDTTDIKIVEADNYSDVKHNLYNVLTNCGYSDDDINFVINTANMFSIICCDDVDYRTVKKYETL